MQAHSAKIVTLEPGTLDVIHEENIDIEYVQKGDIVKVGLFVCPSVFYRRGILLR